MKKVKPQARPFNLQELLDKIQALENRILILEAKAFPACYQPHYPTVPQYPPASPSLPSVTWYC